MGLHTRGTCFDVKAQIACVVLRGQAEHFGDDASSHRRQALSNFLNTGLHDPPMPHLWTLDWHKEPHLCEAVILETQAYRRRDRLPLPAPAAPLAPRGHARPRRNPVDMMRRLDQDFKEVYKKLMSLPRLALREPEYPELDSVETAAEDWCQRNLAVFRSHTEPCWLQPGTTTAQMYECVINELIQDLQCGIDGLCANWSRIEGVSAKEEALDGVLMQATVIFVCAS